MRAPGTFLPSNSVELVMQPSDDNAIHIFECIFATCQVLETWLWSSRLQNPKNWTNCYANEKQKIPFATYAKLKMLENGGR